MLRQGGDVDTVKDDLSGIGLPRAADGVLHGAFARAVAADDGDEIPIVQRERQVVQRDLFIHGAAVENLCYMAHFKHDSYLLWRRCAFS